MSEPGKKLVIDDAAIPSRRSLSDDVVDRLRSAIVRGTFAPGQRLSEVALAEAFSVSRGPIREALTVLEREGLLKVERHRGAWVTLLSRQDIDEIYELRLALERLAMERAARLASSEDCDAMAEVIELLRDAVERKDVFDTVALDVRFHDLIYRAARHDRLYQSWALLRPQIETFLNSRPSDQNAYLDKAVREHSELLDVIRRHEREQAVTMIELHIRSAYDRVSKFNFKN
jgi:DNA-binding GntR family transcriptional regulator